MNYNDLPGFSSSLLVPDELKIGEYILYGAVPKKDREAFQDFGRQTELELGVQEAAILFRGSAFYRPSSEFSFEEYAMDLHRTELFVQEPRPVQMVKTRTFGFVPVETKRTRLPAVYGTKFMDAGTIKKIDTFSVLLNWRNYLFKLPQYHSMADRNFTNKVAYKDALLTLERYPKNLHTMLIEYSGCASQEVADDIAFEMAEQGKSLRKVRADYKAQLRSELERCKAEIAQLKADLANQKPDLKLNMAKRLLAKAQIKCPELGLYEGYVC